MFPFFLFSLCGILSSTLSFLSSAPFLSGFFLSRTSVLSFFTLSFFLSSFLSYSFLPLFGFSVFPFFLLLLFLALPNFVSLPMAMVLSFFCGAPSRSACVCLRACVV
ncbi:hypothetical protein B0H11DRAFT_2121580, partial [Mycena galericulata]